ncbi:MAG: radical SAM protein, partial [bacterium]
YNCPRFCNKEPFCLKTDSIKVNIYQLHNWEEPPISGTNGSGTIFFSNCNLRCLFCQNYKISHLGSGMDFDSGKIMDICYELKEKGAHNINFVTPTPYTDKLISIMQTLRKQGFDLPFVWNCGGYESLNSIKAMDGLVDIYLPDFKYSDNKIAIEYSQAPNYYENAINVISEMRRQKKDSFNNNGLMKSGLIIRHLVLPGHVENSKGVLRAIKQINGTGTLVSLMSQYCPIYKALDHKVLSRKLSHSDYDEVCDFFIELDFNDGYVQDFDSATEEYIPDFK